MKSLTPEQQAFAEEHHGLLLDFMAKHSLGDDYYDLLANRYLKVVVRYLSEEALRKYWNAPFACTEICGFFCCNTCRVDECSH